VSIEEISRDVSHVVFLISINVAFLYSGIIKNMNLGSTFCIQKLMCISLFAISNFLVYQSVSVFQKCGGANVID
jgi:hypothetical protein